MFWVQLPVQCARQVHRPITRAKIRLVPEAHVLQVLRQPRDDALSPSILASGPAKRSSRNFM